MIVPNAIDQPVTIISILVAIILVISFHKWTQNNTKHDSKKDTLLPPSPPKLPILGNIHQLISLHPHRSLRKLSERYGELMIIHLGRAPVLVASSSRMARELTKTQDSSFCSRPTNPTLSRLLYDGKDVGSAPYGEYWRKMKSICVVHLLSTKMVRSFASVRKEETQLLMQMIESHFISSPSKPLNLNEIFIGYTKDMISKVVLGTKDGGGVGNIDFKKLLKEFLELLSKIRVGDYIPWLSWINWIDGWSSKVDRVANQFDYFLEQVVKQRRDQHTKNKINKDNDGDNVKDFVDVLIHLQDNSPMDIPFEKESIKALLLDMFVAGTDTNYTVLEWTMSELLKHPTILSRLQNEIREIMGARTWVDEEDIEKMNYLKAVLKEIIRLHPPSPFLVRRSIKDTFVNGYEIPTGVTVIINIWAIQRDVALWEDPERFNPDRFLNSSIDFRGQDFELLPFGSGRRMCPGMSFAMTNNELVLANLLHKFDWVLPKGVKGETLDMSESAQTHIHRKTPLYAIAKIGPFGNIM